LLSNSVACENYGDIKMITAFELGNRIKEYRERAFELRSNAPNCQSEGEREAMLYFANGYEYMADIMAKSQETEKRLLLN
jgi:hypothetical protein